MSRAGLISFVVFFAFCVGLSASAPVPERLSSLAKRHDYDNIIVARYFDTLLDPEFDRREGRQYSKYDYLSSSINNREFGAEYEEYTQRDYDTLSTFDERDIDDVEISYAKRYDSNTFHRRSIFDKIRNAFKKAGNAIKKGFNKVQSTFKKAAVAIKSVSKKVAQPFKAVGNKMKNGFQSGFQKVGQGFRTAGRVMKGGLQTAGNYLKKSGAMVAKFGLKVLAAGATVAGKVVGFIPGIGTAASKILKGIAMGANEGSKRIHADLPGNLEKASEGMDYVVSPMASLGKLAGGAKAKQAFAVMENIF
ncbi:hypothetical protein GALMADRAFT_271448 [Galerina marginata CBS 339.88]|uniref:Uncharacterized protein n=1 Tax=Galerina marginata (strain CBS 339.88) TaxID=685588 RepID=A0A067SI94_GALM3|nr:hypothetical protein GALMADRAFT_271448 [Galerina marginata CBS 339.88]